MREWNDAAFREIHQVHSTNLAYAEVIVLMSGPFATFAASWKKRKIRLGGVCATRLIWYVTLSRQSHHIMCISTHQQLVSRYNMAATM